RRHPLVLPPSPPRGSADLGARPGRDLPRRARSSDRGRPATVRRFGAGTAAQPRSAGGTGSAGGAPRARTFLLAIAGRAGATVDYWAYRPARRCRRRIPADCRDRSGDGDGIGLGPCPHDADPATGYAARSLGRCPRAHSARIRARATPPGGGGAGQLSRPGTTDVPHQPPRGLRPGGSPTDDECGAGAAANSEVARLSPTPG